MQPLERYSKKSNIFKEIASATVSGGLFFFNGTPLAPFPEIRWEGEEVKVRLG